MPKARNIIPSSGEREGFDFEPLLHPASAFAHPEDVVRDADLTLNEKRAILASWASDACAVDSASAVRKASNGAVVGFDDVMEALRSLDHEAAKAQIRPQNPFKRRLAHWKFNRLSGEGASGMGLH